MDGGGEWKEAGGKVFVNVDVKVNESLRITAGSGEAGERWQLRRRRKEPSRLLP